MENEVWNKAAQFLKILRCEDTGRASYLELSEYRTALREKQARYKELEVVMVQAAGRERKIIQDYVDASENCAEEENQQAYLQGIIDSILLMSGMGLLEKDISIENLIEQLKD